MIAAHADEALAMLDDPSAAESALLGAFRYSKNIAMLHSDASLMPKRRAVWSSWNYIGPPSPEKAANGCTVTYWMNRLQNISPRYAALRHAQSAAHARSPHHRRRASLRASAVRRGGDDARSSSSGPCKASAIPGSAARISAPAFMRTACKRDWRWARRSVGCGVRGRSPTSRAGYSSGKRRRCQLSRSRHDSELCPFCRRRHPSAIAAATALSAPFRVLDAARPRRARRLAPPPAFIFARPLQCHELL